MFMLNPIIKIIFFLICFFIVENGLAQIKSKVVSVYEYLDDQSRVELFVCL